MSDTPQLQAAIRKTVQFAATCATSETSDDYVSLEDQVADLEAQAREALQSKMDFGSLLTKLQKQKTLTPEDLKTLEQLIVGDAEQYVQDAADVDQWRNEARRIIGEISALQSGDLDAAALQHLRSLCRQALGVLRDLAFYFDQKDRAEKFKQATKGPIDSEGYRVLAGIVQGMLESEKM